MYNYFWDNETGGYLLDTKLTGIVKEVRPVYKEELRLLGFDNQFGWNIPDMDLPLMWAEGRRYIYLGECVGEANGGSLYEMPTLKAHVNDLEIQPVNIERMVEKNQPLLTGLVQKTLKFIYDTFKAYEKRTDIAYVAFSGGKDSIVMLDLVQRALPHDVFKVVFADTTMELSDTYESIKKAKVRWPDLNWNVAKSHFKAPESWMKIGPPAEKIRWCCSVHKTAPQVLLIKNIVGKDKFKTLVYVGVRAEESESRSTYDNISESKKHIMQTSCCPILDWNTCELFTYIFQEDLMLNNAYKKGLTRAGCVFCPMSSKWSFFINGRIEPKRTKEYVDSLKELLTVDFSSEDKIQTYFNERNWKLRLNGRDVSIASNKLIEIKSNDETEYLLVKPNNSYMTWLSTIGTIYYIDEQHFQLDYKDISIIVDINKQLDNVLLKFKNPIKSATSIRFFYLLKNALNKSVYCIGCKVCAIECPVGAIQIYDTGEVNIKGCIHCEHCMERNKGCIVAESLSLPIGGSRMKNMAAYQTRGIRQDWVEMYFDMGTNFWANERMGKNMFMAFKAWMKDAEMLENTTPTAMCAKLKEKNSDSLLTWAVIYNNLAYNSSIINWFIYTLDIGQPYNNDTLKLELGDEYTDSVKGSALKSLKETMKASPIGCALGIAGCEMKGNSVITITKGSWQNPEPLAILYSLYKYAEKSDNFYSFTVSDLFDEETERGGISPIKLYNIDRETIVSISKGLAREYIDYIKVNFNKNMMEDIYLDSTKTSFDVVNLF